MDKKNGRPTIAQVADEANVSIATVSRVINGTGVVNEDKAKRVRDAIKKLGYRPNRSARDLRARKSTQKIGMIVGDITTPFFTNILRGVQNTILKENNVLMVGDSMGDPELEQLHYDLMCEEGVSGIVIQFQSMKAANHTLSINDAVPIVAVDFLSDGLPIDCVTINNSAATKKATKHLINLGHRRIGMVCGGDFYLASIGRIQGYKEALAEAGIPIDADLIQGEDFTFESAYEAMQVLCNLPEKPTAVLASNDYTTTGAVKYISEHNLKVPDDIAFIGFDDRPWMSAYNPPLTVIDQHPFHIGVAAAELLMARIKEPTKPTQRVVLEADLIVRKSCGGI